MNRMICSLLAAEAATLAVVSKAQAQPLPEPPGAARVEYRYARANEWRELQRTRREFDARWHSPRERKRFERWYARRCEELRYRGW